MSIIHFDTVIKHVPHSFDFLLYLLNVPKRVWMGVPEYQLSAKFSPKYHLSAKNLVKYQLSVKIRNYQLTPEGIRGGVSN